MTRHNLNTKANWIKLAITIALTVVGIVTQFDVTINQNKTVVASASNPGSYPAIKRAYITEAACRGIKKGDKIKALEERFQGKSDAFGIDMPLAEDHNRTCMAWDDYRDKVHRVTLDLLAD